MSDFMSVILLSEFRLEVSGREKRIIYVQWKSLLKKVKKSPQRKQERRNYPGFSLRSPRTLR